LRLITSSNETACSTGRSAGWVHDIKRGQPHPRTSGRVGVMSRPFRPTARRAATVPGRDGN
jgi:hypothetical protein